MGGEGGEDGLLVGDILAGLVPDSGEVVASSIEEYGVLDDGVEVIEGDHGIAGVAFFKNLVVVVADQLETDKLGKIGLACGELIDSIKGFGSVVRPQTILNNTLLCSNHRSPAATLADH
jgi:hypothetical protein